MIASYPLGITKDNNKQVFRRQAMAHLPFQKGMPKIHILGDDFCINTLIFTSINIF
jgi:hypothetical protein